MTLKCVVVDDEPLAISVLEGYIGQMPVLELVDKFTRPLKALEYIDANDVDLLFVDIQMPDFSGLELVTQLKRKPMVIFTTAFSQFAIDGFKVDAIDYLLKPIDFPDFQKAVNKACDWYAARLQQKSNIKANKEFLFIKSEHRTIRINFNDIIYIQGMSEYVRIHLTGSKPIMSLLSLKSLEAQLPEHLFMRVHKSYIVNLQKINIIERNEILYDGGVTIPVSNQYKAKFQEFIDKNFML